MASGHPSGLRGRLFETHTCRSEFSVGCQLGALADGHDLEDVTFVAVSWKAKAAVQTAGSMAGSSAGGPVIGFGAVDIPISSRGLY